MMRLVVLGLVLCALSLPASAYSETSTSTTSHLISYGSDFSALRTLSNNYATMPDLNTKSSGEVTTELKMKEDGITEMGQGLYFSANKYRGYGGYASLSSSVVGTGVLGMESKTTSTGKSTVTNPLLDPEARTKVETQSFGLGLASPGTDDYQFVVGGGHNTQTTAGLSPVYSWEMKPPKTFTVSFEANPLELDRPADFFSQDVSLKYGISENVLDYYSYGFSQALKVDDVACQSGMDYLKRL